MLKDPVRSPSRPAQPPSPGLFISLEGNIGSGKSTTLDLLPSAYGKIPEPVSSFGEFAGFNPLKLAYENPTECASMCQLHIMDCMVKNFELNKTSAIVTVSERSLHSTGAFILAQEKMGLFHPFVSKYLLKRLEGLLLLSPNPDYTIFLSSPPELCKKHVEARKRAGEGEISIEYLRTLDSVMFNEFQRKNNNITIVLTEDMSKEEVACKVNVVISQLLQQQGGSVPPST